MDQAKGEIKVIAYFAFVHISRTTLLMASLFFQPDCWCRKQHFVLLKRVNAAQFVLELCKAGWGCSALGSLALAQGTAGSTMAQTQCPAPCALPGALCPLSCWGRRGAAASTRAEVMVSVNEHH